ncbi:MAG: glucosyl-3-phosphoglycerate synthase [bacterium]|nr:glucosyl-3-phosphoglycerate synthase [bacterium]
MSSYTIVIALTEASTAAQWIDLAKRLLPDDGTISLCGLVTVPDAVSLSEGQRPAQSLREQIAPSALEDDTVLDDVPIYVDYRPFRRVMEHVSALDADLLLVQWREPGALIGGLSADDIFQALSCDLVLISGSGWAVDGDVLLSLRGGPNITLGVRVALALAQESAITLFHATDQRRTAPDLMLVANAVPQIKRTITAQTDIVDGILTEGAQHKAIVLGASFRRGPQLPTQGSSMLEQIYANLQRPIVLVRGAVQEALEFHAPQLLEQESSLSTRVDRWFAENTFHSSEFSDLRALMALKERRGVTISVALPALNEEKTVGGVIDTLRQAFMTDVPLVDEIVLIDSSSTDRTVEIAESRGIPVFRHPEILADHVGTYTGKGEALWKSLYVTKGDIIAWVDTDITNFHPRFIYGLLGPLLKAPRIQYVKGYYARPIQVGDKIQAYGGGRVTELVARPLLNLFYPELSGIIQPLSGEYAGRRSALEQLPFFTGYGVESGLLIDMHQRYGLEGIAQTDLEVRVHHNQPLVNLSKMAFAILQVFIARMEARYEVQLLEKANRSMKLIIQEPERFALDIAAIGDTERPAMLTLPPYLEKFRPG